MTRETYVTEEGLIDVSTLPHPHHKWVWEMCFLRNVGTFNFWGSYEVTLDEVAGILDHAGVQGVLTVH